MKNYHILFKFLNLNNTDSDLLNEKISKRTEFEINWILEPFVYQREHDAWIMTSNQPYYQGFPQGSYDTKEQAEIALSIWKVKPSKKYTELYQLSNFIINGLS